MRNGTFCTTALLLLLFVTAFGCRKTEDNRDHAHGDSQHGGLIVAVGRDHYHAEIVFTTEGEFKLFTLGRDESQVIAIESQTIEAFCRNEESVASVPIELQPTPQSGDPAGKASCFTGKFPESLWNQPMIVVVPKITINGQRYRFDFYAGAEVMPAKVTDDEERKLYLTAGGLYTEADIQANGGKTASEKYASFSSAHDMHPKSGDRICPITNTKANPQCTWIVDGQTYQFCCPPCIDEFLKMAKSNPDAIRSAASYLK